MSSQKFEQATYPRIEVVLFDYGQVLSRPPNAAAWARMLAITGVDGARLHEAYWVFRHDYDRAALTGRAYWHAVAGRAGIALDEAQLEELLAADVDLWTDLNQPMVDWAARLQRAGVRTAILSNIGDAIAAGIVARLPWLSGFDHCTWSYALRLAKPDPEIYMRTAAALKAPLESILFIDDREDNIAAAATLGLVTVRYSDQPTFEREMKERGFDSLLLVGMDRNTAATPA